MKWKDLSLRWRMVLLIVSIPLIFLIPMFLFIGSQYRTAYRETFWKKGELAVTQVQLIVQEIAPYIVTLEDARGLPGVIQRINNQVEEFDFIALVDERGMVVAYSRPGFVGQIIPELAGLDAATPVVLREFDQGKMYLVSKTMPLPGGAPGALLYIVVGIPATLVEPSLAPLIVVIVLLFIILIVTLNVALNNLVLRPLAQLSAGAQRIGAGELTHKIRLGREDEFGVMANIFNEMTHRIQTLVADLEQRVEDRTAALEQRTTQLEAISLISKQASQMHDVPLLLDTAVNAISEKFGFYHTGIFVLEDDKEWAILRAASSEGGQRMLARGHRLQVGQTGIVGHVAASGKPRIAFDVGGDAVWFDNPDLPTTRSEMALPLKAEDAVIGVLDVQSDQPEAFTHEDISTLQLMTDQLAIALYNARLLEAMESALAEARELRVDYSQRGWARVATRMRPMAYEYDRVETTPVAPLPVPSELKSGRVSRKIVMDGGVPVLLEAMRTSDRVIGYVGLADAQRIWTEEELALVESVSSQVALALENARLFEDTQRNERQQYLISKVLQVAADPNITSDRVLGEIARVLADGLDMAVVIFTFPALNLPVVHPYAVLGAAGQNLPFFQGDLTLSEEHHIFFRGLTRPELGPMAPLLGLDRDAEGSVVWDADTRAVLEIYDFDRVLYVPISSAGVQSGFIALIPAREDPPLDPDTRDLAQNLASQIAVVIDNLNLTSETQRRSEEMQSLYQISLTLSEILEPTEALQAIVEQGVNLFAADAGSFFLYDAETEDLVLTLDYHGGGDAEIGRRVKPGVGLSGRALKLQKALVVTDYAQWEGYAETPWDEQFRSAIGVPLIGRFGALGALTVRSRQKGTFAESDARLAELFAAQAGTALENAQLNKETQQRAEELSQLYDAGIELLTMLDVRELLDRAAHWARRVFNAPTAVLFLRHPDTNEYIRGQNYDSPERTQRHKTEAPSSGGLTETIIRTRQSILYRDNREHPSSSNDKLVAAGLLSQMGVPLRVGEDVIGAMFVNGAEVGQFGDRDLTLLEFLATQVSAALQNSLQFGRTESALAVVERQARYQTNVSQAVALLTERGAAALPDVLRLLGEAAGADAVAYFSIEGVNGAQHWRLQQTWKHPVYEVVTAAMTTMQLPVAAHDFLAAQLSQQPSFVLQPEAAPEAERAFLAKWGFNIALLLAVQMEASLPSFIVLGREEGEQSWSNEEILPLQTASAALSNTIARETLFSQVQASLEETEALYQGSAELNRANSYDGILEVLLEYTILGTGANNVSIQLFDRMWSEEQEPEYSEVVAYWSADRGISRAQHDRYRIEEFPSSRLFMRHAVPTYIEDVATDELLDRRGRALFVRLLGAKSMALVPLVVAGQKIGYLNAIYPQSTKFPEQERRRLASLAQQAAIGVLNIRQLQAIEARARRERMIREITERIQAAPDVDGVLQTALREMGRALGAPRSSVQFRRPQAAAGEVSGAVDTDQAVATIEG